MENLAYQDETWSELIDGKIVMMSPRPAVDHNTVVTNLSRILGNYLEGKRCIVFSDGVDVHLDEKNVFVPDVMIVCNRSIIHHDGIYGAPDFVAEVTSPSTARRDRTVKFQAYEKTGVKEYWLVNPIGKEITVFLRQSDKFVFDNIYTVHPDWEWERMTEEERAEAQLTVKISLYDDLFVDIRKVFANVE